MFTDFQFIDWFMIIAWALIFIITLIIELETMDLVTIWFCISSVVTLVCGILFASPIWQIIIFVVLSVVLLLATRPLTKKMMQRDIIPTNTDRLIGKIGLVTKEIMPYEIGEIKVENELWRAINKDGLTFNVGEKVSIDAIEGIKLVVSKLGSTNIEVI